MDMAADIGTLECTFCVPDEVQVQFYSFIERFGRDNKYSCGLSWLDEIGRGETVKTQHIGHDSIFATRKFLEEPL